MKTLLLCALGLPVAFALSPPEAQGAADTPCFESPGDLGPTLLAAGAPNAHAIAAQLESKSIGVRSLAALAHLNQAELQEVMAGLAAGVVNVGERSLVRRMAELDFSMLDFSKIEFPSRQTQTLIPEAYERDAKGSRGSLLRYPEWYQAHCQRVLGRENEEAQLDTGGSISEPHTPMGGMYGEPPTK
jgi:hypothetical protein